MTLMTVYWLLLGLVLGGALIAFVRLVPRREQTILSIALVVAALDYAVFAFFGAGTPWMLVELVGVAVFGAFAFLGIRRSPIWLATGWALHPVWDAGLHLNSNGASFAAEWYVIACISFDLLVAAYIVARFRVVKLSAAN